MVQAAGDKVYIIQHKKMILLLAYLGHLASQVFFLYQLFLCDFSVRKTTQLVWIKLGSTRRQISWIKTFYLITS